MDAGVALIWADRLVRAAEEMSLGGASDGVNRDSYRGTNGRQIGTAVLLQASHLGQCQGTRPFVRLPRVLKR